MSPQTFVFIGRSGCGKGTQVELLQKYIQEKDSSGEIFYLETGQRFRDFIAQDGYTNKFAKEIQKEGGLQPAFLAIWMWSHILVDDFKGTEHLFVDGTPRKLGEAIIFTEALTFYGRKPKIIYLNVSRKWSEERLLGRGRVDDTSLETIKKRLDWFDTDVAPAVDYLRTNPNVEFFDINGERTIEDIHTDIIGQIKI